MPFERFFRVVTGQDPYLWQLSAAEAILSGAPPREVCAPTGFGKTSVLVAWIWALAQNVQECLADPLAVRRVPVRYVVVVDRRVVVDETADMARSLAAQLARAAAGEAADPAVRDVAASLAHLSGEADSPLQVSVLRGGLPVRPEGPRHPVAPTVVVGTIDLVGSRLLWRGYGVTPARRSIDAALFDLDCMLVLDEAHLARQFEHTLRVLDGRAPAESRLGLAVPGRHVVVMTATPTQGRQQFDWDAEIAHCPSVGQRRARRRAVPVSVVAVNTKSADAAMFDHLDPVPRQAGQLVVGFFNTATGARDTTNKLRKLARKPAFDRKVLLAVGGMPDVARDLLVEQIAPFLASASTVVRRDTPRVLLCATQTLEVGANVDGDELVTPIASRTALIQRLGRVNRTGRREGGRVTILVAPAEDRVPVYGVAAARLGRVLLERQPTTLGALEDLLYSSEAVALDETPPPTVTLPKHIFDAYLRTAGSPHEPPVDRWLRPPDDPRAEAQVAFRESVACRDLDDEALAGHLGRWAPRPSEIWTVPSGLALDTAKKCRPFRVVLMDAARVEATRVLTSSQELPSWTRPGQILVLAPQMDAFSFPGGGLDLTQTGPVGQRPFVLEPDPDDGDDPGDDLPDAGWDIRSLLNAAGEPTGWRERYPITTGSDEPEPMAYGLAQHQHDVSERVRIWAARLRLPSDLVDDLVCAARWHDEGKREPIVQAQLSLTLRDDGSFGRIDLGEPLGKSALPRSWWRRARRVVDLPDAYRHEAASAQYVDTWCAAELAACHDPQLVRHLILTHHGHFRGLGPTLTDAGTVPVPVYQDPTRTEWSGRSDEFRSLNARYGPYSLALAETILRLADWYESGLTR